MDKIKVLHFPLHDQCGGVAQYVLSSWAHMNQKKIQFDLVTRFLPEQLFYDISGGNARIIPVCGAFRGHEKEFFARMSTIMDEGYDVIHLHTSNWFGGFPLEEMALEKKINRIIIHANSAGVEPGYIGGDYERLCILHESYKKKVTLRLATDFCACSQIAAEWIFPQAIPQERIRILKNAIDTNRFAYRPEVRREYRRKLGVEESFVVGTAARFTNAKNPLFLLDVFRELHRINDKARLVWAGTGPQMDEVRTAAADLGDAVCLLGDRDDVPALMQAFDCFLLPSQFEGLGIALIEAQAAGLPCLTSTAVPTETEVTNRIVRFSLDESAKEWAKKLLLITQDFERVDLSQEVAAAGYDLREAAKRLEQLYCGLLQ